MYAVLEKHLDFRRKKLYLRFLKKYIFRKVGMYALCATVFFSYRSPLLKIAVFHMRNILLMLIHLLDTII